MSRPSSTQRLPSAIGSPNSGIIQWSGVSRSAVPADVTRLTAAVRAVADEVWFHGHDTWGLGVANTFADIAAGAVAVDASLGGLGGCPFAPGSSGNTAFSSKALRPTPGSA